MLALFRMASQAGKKRLVLDEKKTLVRKWILEMSPVPPGNLLGVYMDSAYQARAAVFGFPNAKEVYFCVEAVDRNYDLIYTYQSPVCASIEELKPMLETLIEMKEFGNE